MVTLLAPVVPSELVIDTPLPYNVYLANKTLLAHRNEKIFAPDRLTVLQRQGWRVVDEAVPPRNALPVAEAALLLEEQPSVLLEPLPPRPLNEATALVADDMRLTRRALERLLRTEGAANVVSVDSGNDAVTNFFQQQVHLAFLDIDMPGMDGISVLRQIKGWAPTTFVCLVTGVATMTNLQLAMSYGLNACLAKPINAQTLKRTLALYNENKHTAACVVS